MTARRMRWISVLAFLLAGCSLIGGQGGLWSGPSPTPSETAMAPSATPRPAPTATATPTSTPTSTPTPACGYPQGQVDYTSYPGHLSAAVVPVRVFLPPCYEVSDRRFPTVYLLHGWPMDESHWDSLGVDEVAGAGMAGGVWPPFIIVMPYQPQPLFTSSDGGPWSYEAEFVDGLLPWIEANYRTDPTPEARALGGISRGAIWALEIGFLHPDLFGTVAALSPALAVNQPRPEYDPFRIVTRGTALPGRIYLLAGDQDWARDETERLNAVLESVSLTPRLVILPGGHEDALWRGAIPDLLEYLSEPWSVDG